MARPQPITIIDPLPWLRSTATRLALSKLVTAGQLAANEDGRPAVWIEPQASDWEPNPPYGYVVSFIRFHERGFAAPASRFMHTLCYHYGVKLHNFTPNAISQAATFVGVCEGFLGIPTGITGFTSFAWSCTRLLHRSRRPAARRELYVRCTMTSNNAEWERGWFYLRNDGAGLPPTPARC
jgi:hypothetical protein